MKNTRYCRQSKGIEADQKMNMIMQLRFYINFDININVFEI